MRVLRSSLVAATATMVLAACAINQNQNYPPPPPPSASPTFSPSPSPSHTPKPSPSPPKPSPQPTSTGFSPNPVSVTHSVSETPTLVGILYGSHSADSSDRIVFTFNGQIPSYTVKYVSNPTDCGSGMPSGIQGDRHIEVTFNPAVAHDEAGKTDILHSVTIPFPQLRSYKISCDFEGIVTVVVGLEDQTGFRVNELSNPNRVYIDFLYDD